MKMQYFIAIIEIDTEKLDTASGPQLVKQMAELKEHIDKIGECGYYQVTDIVALKLFKADIKRLNP
jgi:hypothetical protein